MPIKKLTVENAEIKTASVEVKTLTISGKQVTLAVFRQLEDEHVLDDECRPLGEVWGRINYHPDKSCGGLGHHMHIIWQKGNELKRCTLDYAIQAPLSLDHDEGWESHFRALNYEWQNQIKDRPADHPEVNEYKAWKSAYYAFWEHCLSLDQLFIAV